MTPEQYAIVGAALFLGAFACGVRASRRLLIRYREAVKRIDRRNRPVLLVIVVASVEITVVAGWIGGLSVLRLLLQTSFPWTPPITLLFAASIVLLPVAFDLAIDYVSSDPQGEDAAEEERRYPRRP